MFENYYLFDEILKNEDMTNLLTLLDINNKTDVVSHVFNRIDQTNVVNKHLRSSRKIEYVDTNLFDWIDSHVVTEFNNRVEGGKFVLIRNDIEVVKYSVGDYFKKHQDYINIDSNEFKNYTFILSLVTCSEGGETVFHITDNQVIVNNLTTSVGNCIVFRKDLIHEGLEVTQGEKFILKGNLIYLPISQTQCEYIVIMFPSKNFYVMDVRHLANSMYESYVNTEKRITPHKTVFFFKDNYSTESIFAEFYASIYNSTNLNKLCKINEFINYTQFSSATSNSKLFNFSMFLNNPNTDNVFYVGINDYFDLLPITEGFKNIIPFQLIELKNTTSSSVVWFGVYDNLYVFSDIYPIEHGYDTVLKYVSSKLKYKKYINPLLKKLQGRETDVDLFVNFPESGEVVIDTLLNIHNLDVADTKNAFPELYWERMMNLSDDYQHEYQSEILNISHKCIFKQYKFQPISQLTDIIEPTKKKECVAFFEKIINGIAKRQLTDLTAENVRGYNNNNRYEIIDDNRVDLKSSVLPPNLLDDKNPLLSFDNLKVIFETAKNANSVSVMSREMLSEFFCNETAYIILDVVCKFGFYRF